MTRSADEYDGPDTLSRQCPREGCGAENKYEDKGPWSDVPTRCSECDESLEVEAWGTNHEVLYSVDRRPRRPHCSRAAPKLQAWLKPARPH